MGRGHYLFAGLRISDAAGWWSDFHFWVGLGALLFVGFSAILSYGYGVRKDELFVHVLNQPVLANKTEEHGFQLRLTAAQKRCLTDMQRRTLIAALTVFPGQKVRFKAIAGDPETQGFRDDSVEVMRDAKWSLMPIPIFSKARLRWRPSASDGDDRNRRADANHVGCGQGAGRGPSPSSRRESMARGRHRGVTPP